ncbi:MAG: hypothetical protein ACJATV_000756 [Granulosicoccus sp.]|jgi:hypothetical protein
MTIPPTKRQITNRSAAIAVNAGALIIGWVKHSKTTISGTGYGETLAIYIMLNLFDTLARKAQYLAGDAKAQALVTYKVVRSLIVQQIPRVLASFLPHKSGEEPEKD